MFYSGETWDAREKGLYSLDVPFVGWKSYTGAPLAKGVHEFVGHDLFQMYDPTTNKWVAACNSSATGPQYPPTGIASCEAIARDTLFTVADLTKYRIEIKRISSDWKKGGYVGVELTLTDAAGETLDLPGAEVDARVISKTGPHETIRLRLFPHRAFFDHDSLDWRYKFFGTMPDEFFEPYRIEVNASVWVLGPDGVLREERVDKSLTRDDLKPVPLPVWQNRERRKDLHTIDGKLRESRFLSAHENYVKWWETPDKARKTVEATKRMGMNILHACIYQSGLSYVHSDIMGTVAPKAESSGAPAGTDTFKLLIREARATNIKVLPMLCCMDGALSPEEGQWQEPQLLKRHPDWAVVDRAGKKLGVSDVHRPEFRALFIRYLADLAKRYDVDGFLLDYIRAMEQCFCERCQQEYKAKTGRELVKDGTSMPFPLPYVEWQEEAVAALVKGIREALNTVRPGMKLCTWGFDSPENRLSCYQGRRPDAWLNNGWIDWFEIGCYGSDPQGALSDWRKIARMVRRPECVWPMFGSYHDAKYRTQQTAHESVPFVQTITGDPIHRGVFARRAEVLLPMYEAFRDQCKLNGFGIFDLCYMTDETLQQTQKLLFPESAVPWFPTTK